MRAQRPRSLAPAVNATAETLPFDDDTFDASMASVTIHQWPDVEAGLAGLRRVTTGPVAILTFDPTPPVRWWIDDYVPELLRVEAKRMPAIDRVAAAIGPVSEVRTILVPNDCTDGFGQAFYGRPERLLEPQIRRAMSAWEFVDSAVVERFVSTLGADLASGAWDEKYGEYRSLDVFDVGMRLVIGRRS